MILEGIVKNLFGSSGSSLPIAQSSGLILGRTGEVIDTPLHGKYYTQSANGNLFMQTTPVAGSAIP